MDNHPFIHAVRISRHSPIIFPIILKLNARTCNRFAVDVTDVPGVTLGDCVTLMGEDGDLSITAEEIAKRAGTLSYEITCGVSARVPRRHLSAE